MRNISECTKVNGYFIGSCYDGRLIFDKLKQKKIGEGITLMDESNTHKIWQIIKQYDKKELKSDSTCVGVGIDIYQETINKTFREYLVNFDYLIRVMENYGFVPLDDQDAKKMGVPSGIGNLKELFNLMEEEVIKNKKLKKDIKRSLDMSENEKYISFLNKYFIFKKIRNVDAKSVKIEIIEEEELETNKEGKVSSNKKQNKKIRLVE
jgi:hypothetical protein